MKDILLKIKVIAAFISLVRDPRKTDRIFAIASAVRKNRSALLAARYTPIFNNPEFQTLHANRENPPVDLEDLRRRPVGSFGRAVAEFLDGHGFEPNAFPMLSYDTPLEFMISRLRQNHDYWHVLTGFDTDVKGEVGLQGFTFAQTEAPISPLIIAAGFLHLLSRDLASLRPAFERVVDGYRMGQLSRSLVTYRLESEWDTDLDELREKLGFTVKVPPTKVSASFVQAG
jgi:ubiquinone biosynthesis protein COQ4